MFVLGVLVYPLILGLLCLGSGLLVDRVSGGKLPAMLLAVIGAALLIGVSQWTTYVASLAPGTPAALVAVAVAGFVLGGRRAAELARGWRRAGWPAAALVIAYVVAVAPVLFAGRVTFASYNVLPDSALHLIGADYLIRHGQHYAHLDLRNSYGQYISGYFGNSYPTGAHTFFGGSAFLLPVPLIWTLQPFCAFVLALGVGPAWVLAQRLGSRAGWAAAAAVTASVPALVYGFALVASIKELVAVPLILALGALLVVGRSSAPARPSQSLPFALVAAAGASAIGVAFGAWALVAAIVLAAVVLGDVRAGRRTAGGALLFVAVGVGAGILAAWPTWIDVSGSLNAAGAIASTSNPGNLDAPLQRDQVFGSWLASSYRHVPKTGLADGLTQALVAITGLAALLGGVQAIRTRAYAVLTWFALGLAVWAGLTAYGQTWTDAKTIMLTSPIVVLLAWAGVAGLRASRPARFAAPLIALILVGGVLASDAIQYHGTDLAPTTRYAELASLDGRFGGGPTLVTDFDEWSLYALRRMDVGGPNFVYRPIGLGMIAPNHGDPVDLDLIAPAVFAAYPLIVTGRDPTASRPPAAYDLVWQGTYYEVWRRRADAMPAGGHLGRSAARSPSCLGIGLLAALARTDGGSLVSAAAPEMVRIPLAGTSHPTWKTTPIRRLGVEMTPRGELTADLQVPRAGTWNLWLQGEVMPSVQIAVDGQTVAAFSGQLRGSLFNPDTLPPLPLHLAAGPHLLTLTRGGAGLGPGDGGSAVLHAMFLTPARAGAPERLTVTPPARWKSLCGGRTVWVEAT
ncbi:MAG: hypothetical protein ACR2KV_18090 [Solirubrobacteraceae bacterium]